MSTPRLSPLSPVPVTEPAKPVSSPSSTPEVDAALSSAREALAAVVNALGDPQRAREILATLLESVLVKAGAPPAPKPIVLGPPLH